MGEAELCRHIDRTIRLGERYILLSNSSLTNRTVRNLPTRPESDATELETLDTISISRKIKELLRRKNDSQTLVNLEERLHQTVLERRASNNLLQRVGASIASVSSFGMSFYVENAFYATQEALMLAGAAVLFGAAAIHSTRAIISRGLATTGAALATVPIALDMPGSMDLTASQTAYILVPGLSVIQGLASAAGWRRMGSLYDEVAELAEFASDSRMARRKLVRAKKIVDTLDVSCGSDVREPYSDACISYIENGGEFPKPGDFRKTTALSRLEVSLNKVKCRREEPERDIGEQPYDQRTYSRLVSYGLEESDARELARKVSPREVERIWNLLGASVMPYAENAKGVVGENPQIFRQGKRIQGYADALRETLGIVNEVFYRGIPDSFSIGHHPERYASPDALDEILGCLSLDEGKSSLVEASYVKGVRELGYDPVVLSALLRKGFRLGTSSPQIGMRYTNGQRILHRAQSALSGGYDRELVSTFQMLKRSGAVWMEKERKNTGAAGCWSITSHPATDIDDQPLRLFIRAAYDRRLPKFDARA